jgi:hypothetical protein
MYSNADPWKEFEPDFRITFATPPIARPISASKLFVEMSTDWIDSAGGMMICSRPVRSSSSMPSIWYRLPIRGIPFTRVCSAPCALKNCECSYVAGDAPGTRFSSD